MSRLRITGAAEEYPGRIEPTHVSGGRRPASPLQDRYLRALVALDLAGSRDILAEAAEGESLGRVYADLVRPALVRAAAHWEAGTGRPRDRRLVLASVEAGLRHVALRPVAGAGMRGAGREALVSIGAGEVDALDGRVIVDTLSGDGWSVTEIEAGADAAEVAALAERTHVELVVTPSRNAADLLLSALVYTGLRRLADPPVIVACGFGRADDTRRARAAGADAYVNDPDDLLTYLDGQLPARGDRNWGVTLRRVAGTLVVAPTGHLDPRSVARLREVAESRLARFDALIVDTRDVASAPAPGIERLVAWLRESAAAGRRHRLLAGPLVEAAVGPDALDADQFASPADAGI
jgi:CheY-like chemotaxis protein